MNIGAFDGFVVSSFGTDGYWKWKRVMIFAFGDDGDGW